MDLRRLDHILTKAQDTDLTVWEESFISDVMNRRERLGDAVLVSEKQEDILERISEK